MTDTNPRDLIQRLADALNDLSEHLEAETPAPTVQNAHKAWKEARAYLAQFEPEVPTDEELKAAYWEAFKDAAPCGADESWLSGLRAVARLGVTCPYIVSSDEGTSYCRLAEQS